MADLAAAGAVRGEPQWLDLSADPETLNLSHRPAEYDEEEDFNPGTSRLPYYQHSQNVPQSFGNDYSSLRAQQRRERVDMEMGDDQHELSSTPNRAQPWFSEEFRTTAVFSIAEACINAVVDHRNTVLGRYSASGIAMKGVIYLTTELALILLIPVAIIEGVARFAIACLVYPLAAMHIISDDPHENMDDSYDFYAKVVSGHLYAAGAILKASHGAVAHLNPKAGVDLDADTISRHFPLITGFVKMQENDY